MTRKRSSESPPAEAGAVPAGWGFAVAKPAEPVQARSGPLYQFQPGTFKADDPADVFQQTLIQTAAGEIRRQLDMFEDSGRAAHLWRAWRTARAIDPMPPAFLEWIAPYLDKLSEVAKESDKRVSQRETRDLAVREYYLLTEMAEAPKFPAWKRTQGAILEMVASHHGTTGGTVRQWVVEHERGRCSE